MAKQLNKKLVVGLTIAGMVVMLLAAGLMVAALQVKDPQYYVKQAQQASAAGEHSTAARSYARAWRVSNDPQYLIVGGQEALESGDLQMAQRLWLQAISANPKLEGAHQKIMELRLELGKLQPRNVAAWEEVLKTAETLLEINPANSVGLNARGLAKLGLRNVKESYAEEGLKDLEAAHKLMPENPEYAEGVARYYWEAGERCERNARVAEAEVPVLEGQGRQGDAEQKRNDARKNREDAAKDFEKAEGIYRVTLDAATRLATSGPNRPARGPETAPATDKRKAADAHRYYGVFLLRRGRLAESFDHLQQAVALAPDNVDNHIAIGDYWIQQTRLDFERAATQPGAVSRPAPSTRPIKEEYFVKAEAALRQSIEANPNEFTNYLALGMLYQYQGDPKREMEVYDERLGRTVVRTGIKALLDRNYKLELLERAARAAMRQISGRPEDKAADDQLLEKAEKYYRVTITEAPGGENDPTALAMKGRIEALRGNAREAIKNFRAAVERLRPEDPRNAELLWALGDLQTRVGATGLAAKALESAVRWYGDNDEVWARFAGVLFSNQDGRALEAAQRAIQINPKNVTALRVLREIYRQQKNLDKVNEINRELGIAGETEQPLALLARARQTFLQAGGYEGADAEALKSMESDLRAVLQKDPVNSTAIQQLIGLLTSTKRESEINALYEAAAAAAAKEESETLEGARKAAEKIADAQEKEKVIAAARKSADERKRAVERTLDLLKVRNDPKRSLEERTKAAEEIIAQDPDEFNRESNYIDLYVNNNDPRNALVHAKKAVALKPDDTAMLELVFRLATALKDEATAQEILKKAAEQNLDSAGGHFYAARYAQSRNELEKAVREYRAGLELAGTNYAGQAMLGRALLEAGRLDEAQEAFAKALEINPNTGLAHVGLAQLAERRGQADVMARHFARAKELLPSDPWVQQKIQDEAEEKNPESAIEKRERLRKNMPTDPQKIEPWQITNLLRLGALYAVTAKYDKAEEVFKEAVDTSAANEKLRNWAAPTAYARFFFARKDKPDPARGLEILKNYAQSMTDKKAKSAALLLVGSYIQDWQRSGLPGAPSQAEIDAIANAAIEADDGYEALMGVGGWYRETQRLAEAEKYFRRAIEKARAQGGPDGAGRERDAKRYLIDLMLRNRDVARQADTEKAIREYVEQYPADTTGLLFQSQFYILAGRETEAIASLSKCLEKDPNNAQAYFRRGYLYARQQKWDAAVEDLQKAKSQSRSGFNYEHRVLLANAFLRKGQPDAALNELESILRDEPASETTARQIVDLCARLQRIDQAETKALEYRARFADSPYWPLRLAQLAESRETKNGARIVEYYRAAAEMTKFRPELVAQVLRAMMSFEQFDEVIRYVTQVIPPDKKTPDQIATLGVAYARTKQDDAARKALETAMDQSKASLAAFRQATDSYQAAFGLDAALKKLQERLAAAPNDAVVRFSLSMLQLRQADEMERKGRRDEANALREQVARALQETAAVVKEDPVRLELLRAQAQVVYTLKRYEETVKLYKQMLDIAPEDLVALNNLAYMLMTDMNQPKESLQYAKKAAELAPFNANVLDTYGWNLAMLGQYTEALGPLGIAIDAEPDNAAVLYHRAATYHKISKLPDQKPEQQTVALARAKDEARRAYDAAVKKNDRDMLKLAGELLKELGLDVPAPPPGVGQ